MVKTTTVAVSIPLELLSAIDEELKNHHRSRSALICAAVKQSLRNLATRRDAGEEPPVRSRSLS